MSWGRQERLSKEGDPLQIFLAGTVEFERSWPLLTRGLGHSDGSDVSWPAFDPFAMFRVLLIQAPHNLSNARMEFIIRYWVRWMRFFWVDFGGARSIENTIRHPRSPLTKSGTLEALIQAFAPQMLEAGYVAMCWQIVEPTLAPAPKQHNIGDEKAAIKAAKSAKQIWRGKPDKATRNRR